MDQSLRVLIEKAEFKESFRGYDRAQVDDMLEQLATQAGKLESQLADVETRLRAEAETEVQARVQAELEARGTGGGDPAVDEERRAEEVRLTLVMAQRTADAAIREARAKAQELVADARGVADRTTADARAEATRERQQSRKDLADEVVELESVRTVLQGDIDALEEHVRAQREHLLGSIENLRKVLDDPKALRTTSPPQWTQVTIPDIEQPADAEQPLEASEPDAGGAAPAAHSGQPDVSDKQQGLGANPLKSPAEPKAADAKPADPKPVAAQAKKPSAAQQPAGASHADTVVDHPTPGVINPGIGQPPAPPAPVGSARPIVPAASVDVATEEDGFLAELRKAMTEDQPPAGPRDAADAGRLGDSSTPPWADVSHQDQSGPPAKSRFGRRR